jgi:hypothetical protein
MISYGSVFDFSKHLLTPYYARGEKVKIVIFKYRGFQMKEHGRKHHAEEHSAG